MLESGGQEKNGLPFSFFYFHRVSLSGNPGDSTDHGLIIHSNHVTITSSILL